MEPLEDRRLLSTLVNVAFKITDVAETTQVDSLNVGGDYKLQVYVQDAQGGALGGVFQAYFDLTFPDIVSFPTSLGDLTYHGSIFTASTHGVGSAGAMLDVGGLTPVRPASPGEALLLLDVPIHVVSVGAGTFGISGDLVHGANASVDTVQMWDSLGAVPLNGISFTGPGPGGGAITVTSNQSSSATSLESSINPSNYGDSVTFTATVTAAGAPSGSVTFFDGLTPLNPPSPLVGGTATYTTSKFGAGVHNITAVYGGDATTLGSTSPVLQQTVNQATLTVTANSASRVYGNANPTFTITYSGFQNGETLATSGVTGSPSLTTTATPSSPAGSYAITATTGTLSAANYQFSLVDGQLTVTPATLTVTANNASRIYGDANPMFTATYAGFKNGETLATSGVTGSPGLTATATPSGAVSGSPYAITAAVGTLSAANYQFSFVDGELMVTPAALTVTADNESREYGGANPTFTATYDGFKNGETLATSDVTGSPSLTTTATPGSPAGSYTITAAVGTLSTGNYEFSFVDGQLTVTPATLTVTVDNASRLYGDANPTFTATYSGFKNGETLATSDVTGSPSLATAATPTSPAGTYPITAAAGTLSAVNYQFSFVDGTLTVTGEASTTTTITTAPGSSVYGDAVTFDATVVPVSSEIGDPTGIVSFYDGATLIGSGQLINGTATCSAVSSLSAGAHLITATYGGDINFAPSSSSSPVDWTVTPATLTVTADNVSRTYGDANPTLTVTYDGFKNGETLGTSGVTGSPSLSTTATPTSAVSGSPYTITAAVGTLSAENYQFSVVDGQLTVTPATLTITVNNESREYGDANPTFTATYDGFKNGETLATSGVTGSPSLTTTATPTSPTGSYTITAAVGTLSAENYQFSFVDGQLTVTPATLTVTADSASRAYGDANPTFTATYDGFKNGETLGTSGVTGSPSLTTTATPTSAVSGSPYTITAAVGTLSAENYQFSVVDGQLTVTPATLTITVNNESREYGDANPTFTATYDGFKNGETLATSGVTGSPSLTTTATPTSAVSGSPYAITAAVGTLSGENYQFSFADGQLTVTPATLTVTADSASRAYGDANPTFTATYDGFKNGETLGTSGVTGSPSLTTTATSSSPAGSYPITAAAGTLSAENYQFSFENGTLTVTAPDLTLAKTDSVSHTTTPGNPWTWTLHVANVGNAPATFSSGQTLLLDNLPNSNVGYGAVTVTNLSGITGTIVAGISTADDLTATATGGSVTIAAGGSFDVQFTATPTAAGEFANPRTSGTATADPGDVVAENDETNNTASDTVTVQIANSSIVGFVYCDNDGDGVYAGNATIPHVTITLQYQDSNGAWQNWTTSPYRQTNDQGWYGFGDLPAGTYRVIETQPVQFTEGGTNTIVVNLPESTRKNASFGDGGLKPQYISRRLFLSSTPSMSQIVRNLNVPPVVDLNGAAAGNDLTTKFFADGGPITITPAGATILDSDSPTLVSLAVTITNPYDGAAEVLDADVTSTSISKSYTNGVLTLTGVAPIADYAKVLRSITYDDTATTLLAPDINRIVTFVAYDGMAYSTVATASISDPPAPTSSVQQASSPAAVNLQQSVAAASASTATPAQTTPQQATQESTAAPPAASADPVEDAPVPTPDPPVPSVVRNGSEVVVTGTAADETFEFVAGASEHTVIVAGQSYAFAAAEVTTFHFDGGGGNDTAKLTAVGLAALAESAQLQSGSATLQGIGYTVNVADVQDVQIDGRGEGVQAALFDSPGDDSLTAQGDVVSLSGDGFVETVFGFKRVRASAIAGGHDTLRALASDQLLETVGDWVEEV